MKVELNSSQCQCENFNCEATAAKDYDIELGPFCFVTTCNDQWALCEYVIVHTNLPPSPVISVDRAGWQAKMASIEFGYHDVMCTVAMQPLSIA